MFNLNKHKTRYEKLVKLISHKVDLFILHNFNSVVKIQLNNFKRIPVIIISFNQLHFLKQLIEFLQKNGYENIVILDNNSTYPPLLRYFESLENDIAIHRLNDNLGHLAFWKREAIFKQYSKGYYVVTDPDVVPIDKCPEDFLEEFRKLLDRAHDRTKVGFSLKLADIPDTNPNKSQILQWESQFWKSKIRPSAYKAEIDTTFALYRPKYNYNLKHFTKAWRTDYPIQARHGGWYIDIDNLTEEQEFYLKTANDSASWQINKKGDLVNEVHKTLYER